MMESKKMVVTGEEMSNADYRKHEGISKSSLMKLTVSPKYFKYCLDNPEDTKTKDLTFGSAAHKWILEREDFFDEFIIEEQFDKRTKEGKEKFAEFEAKRGNREVISQADFETIQAMADTLLENKWAKILLTGDHEKSFFWVDEETGEPCKCRPDCLSEFKGQRIIVDYKTTRNPEYHEFQKSIEKYGYDLQAGMYTEGMKKLTGDNFKFVFIAQEKKAPYDFNIFECDEQMMKVGTDLFHYLLRLLNKCKNTGNWYGVIGEEGKINTMTLPKWLQRDSDEESEDFE